MHLSDREIRPFLVNRLQAITTLPCIVAENGLPIEKGHIYVAQPGEHLLVKDGKLLLGHGPEENNFRPSIDTLFRSAASAYDGHTIGVILTGLLQDGTSGMEAIKRSGGTLVVQDPEEAEFPGMPLSVLRNMTVDYSLRLEDIGPAISNIVQNKVVELKPIPSEIVAEARRAERMLVGIAGMDELGERSPYGCPDCGGALWKMKEEGNINRYHCHIGHAYMEEDLLAKQVKAAETSIWVAVRMLEERRHLLVTKAEEFKEKRLHKIGENYGRKAEDLKNHIEQLKSMLIAIETNQTTA